jgi:hypothetical protein
MPAPEALLDLYLNLADASEEQGKPLQRDKFLVLAAGAAQGAGFLQIAEDCRCRILKNNPNHLLREFASMAEAVRSEDLRGVTAQLLRAFPFEKAEYLLSKFRDGGFQHRHKYPELAIQPKKSSGSASLPPAEFDDPRRASEVTEPADWTRPRRRATAERATPEISRVWDDESAKSPASSKQWAPTPGVLRCWVLFSFALGLAVGLAVASWAQHFTR